MPTDDCFKFLPEHLRVFSKFNFNHDVIKERLEIDENKNFVLSPLSLKDYFNRNIEIKHSSLKSLKDINELPGFRGGKFTQQSKEYSRFPYEQRANYYSQRK